MAAITPQVLAAESGCLCSVTAPGTAQAFRLALLTRTLETLGITMTSAELLEYGKCYGCLGLTNGEIAEIALLDLISQNIGGGGGGGVGAVMRGSGPPVADPADTSAGAYYYDDDSTSPSYDTGWHWSVPDQLWIGA